MKYMAGRLFLLPLLLFVIMGSAHTAHAASYYVDSVSGLNTNSGTSTSTPWQTLSKVNGTTLSAGDTVYLARGETFAGTLVANQSGTAGNPITYSAYGTGANPLINAMGYSHGIDIRNGKSYVNVNGIDVEYATSDQYFLNNSVSFITISNTTITSTSSSAYGFNFITGTTTDVTIQNATTTIAGSGRNDVYMQTGTYSNILINSLYSASGGGTGIATQSTSNITNLSILNSTLSGHGIRGIGLAGTLTGLTISTTTANNNIGYDGIYIAGTTTNATLTNITANNNGNQGVYFSGVNLQNISLDTAQTNGNAVSGVYFANTGSNATVSNVSAANNLNDGFDVHNNWTNVIFDHDTALTNGVNGQNGDGDGFSYHETTTGIVRNSIARNNIKSAIAHINTASTTMYNNVLSNDMAGTIPLVTFLTGTTNNFFNNTLYNPSGMGTGISAEATSSDIIKNNIVYGFSVGIEQTGSSTVVSDYNDVYGAASSSWSGLTAGAHSLSADPRFTSTSTLDFTLQSSSPAINAATTTPYTTDYLGNSRVGAPDMGAYEYQLLVDRTPPSISSIAASATDTSVTISWTTDEAASSNVYYGTTTSYGTASTSAPLGTSHAIELTGLDSGTTYHYVVVSTDAAGNTATSSDQTVATTQPSASGSSGGSSGSSSSSSRHSGGGSGANSAGDITTSNGTTASDSSVTTATGGTSTALVLTRDLTLGSSGSDVSALQQFLTAHGFSIPAGATGYFGAQTKIALAAYQAAHGIVPALGYFGALTRSSLAGAAVSATGNTSTTATPVTSPEGVPTTSASLATLGRDLMVGSQGTDVQLLQKVLNENRFTIATSGPGSSGNETTYFGPSTRDAVIRMQTFFGITPAQGYVGAKTRELMQQKGLIP